MSVAEQYPPLTDDHGITWYRPDYTGTPPQMWGWTSDPQQAHPSYQAVPLRPGPTRKEHHQ